MKKFFVRQFIYFTRKTAMSRNNLDAKITFRTTKENRNKLEKLAESQHLSLSNYIINCCNTNTKNMSQRQELAESIIKLTNEINKLPSNTKTDTLTKELDILWQKLI